jgi:hypothetical protein
MNVEPVRSIYTLMVTIFNFTLAFILCNIYIRRSLLCSTSLVEFSGEFSKLYILPNREQLPRSDCVLHTIIIQYGTINGPLLKNGAARTHTHVEISCNL